MYSVSIKYCTCKVSILNFWTIYILLILQPFFNINLLNISIGGYCYHNREFQLLRCFFSCITQTAVLWKLVFCICWHKTQVEGTAPPLAPVSMQCVYGCVGIVATKIGYYVYPYVGSLKLPVCCVCWVGDPIWGSVFSLQICNVVHVWLLDG